MESIIPINNAPVSHHPGSPQVGSPRATARRHQPRGLTDDGVIGRHQRQGRRSIAAGGNRSRRQPPRAAPQQEGRAAARGGRVFASRARRLCPPRHSAAERGFRARVTTPAGTTDAPASGARTPAAPAGCLFGWPPWLPVSRASVAAEGRARGRGRAQASEGRAALTGHRRLVDSLSGAA